jgi:hypothetical protein
MLRALMNAQFEKLITNLLGNVLPPISKTLHSRINRMEQSAESIAKKTIKN